MFFKYDFFTQRLVSAPHNVALANTVSPQPLQAPTADVKIHYEYKPLSTYEPAKLPVDGKGGYPVPNVPAYRRLMQLQTKFGQLDGKLVWQKLPRDMGTYYLALALVGASTVITVYGLLRLVSPPRNN